MTWIKDIDYMFLWLINNLRTIMQRVNTLEKCRAVRILKQIKELIGNRPVFSVFLSILVSLVFPPLLSLLTFVSSSFVVVSVSTLTVFGGTFVVALVSFLVVLSPALVFGGILALLVYLHFCLVLKILQIINRLKQKYFAASRRLRYRRHRRRRESVNFVGSQVEAVRFPVEYEHSFIPPLK